ncbi:MAG TPA: DUF1232 domain-containing protein [Kineosporiaceae bacterium]|nr:DUF1232 domain-containing protein [Kineosporiaceae bacterium]
MSAKRRVAALAMLWRALHAGDRPGGMGIGAQLAAVPRMLWLSFTGRYPGLAKTRMVMAALGVLYVFSPLDLMPEILLGVFGLGDDALVTAWVVGALLGETDAFLRWEAAGRARVVVGQVVP